MRTKPANRSDTLLPGGSPDDVHPTQSAGKLYSHTRGLRPHRQASTGSDQHLRSLTTADDQITFPGLSDRSEEPTLQLQNLDAAGFIP